MIADLAEPELELDGDIDELLLNVNIFDEPNECLGVVDGYTAVAISS